MHSISRSTRLALYLEEKVEQPHSIRGEFAWNMLLLLRIAAFVLSLSCTCILIQGMQDVSQSLFRSPVFSKFHYSRKRAGPASYWRSCHLTAFLVSAICGLSIVWFELNIAIACYPYIVQICVPCCGKEGCLLLHKYRLGLTDVLSHSKRKHKTMLFCSLIHGNLSKVSCQEYESSIDILHKVIDPTVCTNQELSTIDYISGKSILIAQ